MQLNLSYRESNKSATLALDGNRLVSVSCWWDPAYGAPDKGDSSVVAAIFTDEAGSYWLVTVETNGIGRFLVGLLRQQFRRSGLACAVVEHASRANKDVRILEAFDAVLAAGRLAAHQSVFKTPFIEEMREWRPGHGKCRDDGLDAVAGCLLAEPVRLPRLAGRPGEHRQSKPWRGGSCYQAEQDFAL